MPATEKEKPIFADPTIKLADIIFEQSRLINQSGINRNCGQAEALAAKESEDEDDDDYSYNEIDPMLKKKLLQVGQP